MKYYHDPITKPSKHIFKDEILPIICTVAFGALIGWLFVEAI